MALQLRLEENGKPVDLAKLDEDICKALGVECDASKWYLGWMDTVGFILACGKTMEEAREYCKDFYYDYGPILDYLESRNLENTSYST